MDFDEFAASVKYLRAKRNYENEQIKKYSQKR